MWDTEWPNSSELGVGFSYPGSRLNNIKLQYLWRSYAGYVLLALLGVSVLCGYLLVDNSGKERAETRRDLEIQAGVLAEAALEPLARGDQQVLARLVTAIAGRSGMRVSVIDASGVVLVDSLEAPSQLGNLRQRAEVQVALTGSRGEAERYSDSLRQTFLYTALPMMEGNRVLGVARLGRGSDDIAGSQLARQLTVLGAAALALLLMLALGLYLAWRRSVSLDLITQTAEAIAQGDFDRRVAESRVLGMKRLADAINQMARNSARRVQVLTADRNRLAAIFTGMVEGVIDVDQKQNILHINEAAAVLLGVNRERCVGKPVWQEIRHQKITLALDEAIKGRTVINSQIDYTRENDLLYFDIYVASLSDDQGGPIGAVLVLHDVTDLRNLERVRTDFVANASHELKTPITAIRGLSETVIGDAEVERDTLMQFMERIHAQSIRLSQLVGDLMTISRLESDQSTNDFALINFGELVSRAVLAFSAVLESKQLNLRTAVPEPRIEVFGDRQNLSQLVDNLVDNAIKYTPAKGLVQVRVKLQGGGVILEVEDSGIGISPQYQQRVFERFYRVDKARSQSLGGTGLGLSIVKNIAERHGGNVSVTSQLGRGSIFTFRMPLAGTHTDSQ